MINRRCASGLFSAICALALSANASDLPSSMSVRVSLEKRSPHPSLKFELSNNSATVLIIGESSLPWSSRECLLIVGASKKEGTLPGRYAIEDRVLEDRVVIKPGVTLAGEIQLDEFVTDLEHALRKSDVQIFWYYEPYAHNGQSLGKYGGWVPISETN
jgi:hypothetical protein